MDLELTYDFNVEDLEKRLVERIDELHLYLKNEAQQQEGAMNFIQKINPLDVETWPINPSLISSCCFYRSLCYEILGMNDYAVSCAIQSFQFEENLNGYNRLHQSLYKLISESVNSKNLVKKVKLLTGVLLSSFSSYFELAKKDNNDEMINEIEKERVEILNSLSSFGINIDQIKEYKDWKNLQFNQISCFMYGL